MKTSILLRRAGAMGDVVLTTPIAARLRLENPNAKIDIETYCPEVYQGPGWKNPHINTARRAGENNFRGYDRLINLDMVSEQDRGTPPISMYMRHVFGDDSGSRQIIIPISPTPPQIPGHSIEWRKTIAVHANTSWKNRTIPVSFWQTLAKKFTKYDWNVLLLGTRIDQVISGPGIINTIEKLNLYEQVSAINYCRAFICGDSGMLVASWATDTPIVPLLTITPARLSTPHRHGEWGWNYLPYPTLMECYGCQTTYKNVTMIPCKRGDFACIDSFKVDKAFDLTMQAIHEDKRNLKLAS